MGVEPSEVLVWRDESLHLSSAKLSVNLPEELILKLYEQNVLPAFKPFDATVYVHLHCHQKSLLGEEDTINALSLIPKLKIKILNTGCCGMAGDFGLKHPKLAHVIYKQSFGALDNSIYNNLIVTGFSCFHIIKHSTLSVCHYFLHSSIVSLRDKDK